MSSAKNSDYIYWTTKASCLECQFLGNQVIFFKLLVASRISALKLNFLFKLIELQTPPPPIDRYHTTYFDLLDDRVRECRSLVLHANSQVAGVGEGMWISGGRGVQLSLSVVTLLSAKKTGSSSIFLVSFK